MPASPRLFSRIGGQLALVGACLLALTSAAVFLALLQIAASLDREALKRTSRAVGSALASRQFALERTLVDYAAWGAAYENLSASTNADWAYTRGNLGASLYTDFDIDGVLAIDPSGRTTYAVTNGELSGASLDAVLGDAANELVQLARSAPENETVPVSSYLAVGGVNMLVATAAFSTAEDTEIDPVPGPATVLVFIDKLSDTKLLALGEQFAIPELRSDYPPYSAVHLTAPAAMGEAAVFAWSPPEPGKELLNSILPWLAAGATLLAVTTFIAYRNAMIAARSIDEGRKHLFESEARFRDIAESASDWMWETDAELVVVYASDRLSDVTGREMSEILGQPLANFLEVDAQKVVRIWGNSTGRAAEVACTYLDSTGSCRVGRVCGKPVFDVDGSITGYRGTVTDITEETAALEEVSRLSRHDPTTGLSNRTKFEAYLDSLTECYGANPVALVCLDLDDFKSLNESRGYKAGDRALAETADRLQAITPPYAMIARLGSDEFAVALPVDDEKHASDCCASLLSALEQPLPMADGFRLGATAGISLFPKDAGTAEGLLRKADIALVEAKRVRRGGFKFFSDDLNEVALERAFLRTDLRTAVVEKQFVLHYQPKFDPRSLKPTGVEALVRWNHPVRGLIQPSAFIGAAEEFGFIDAIGAWALETACREIHPLGELPVSVNVSPVQIRNQEAFFEAVAHALEATDFSPSRLELELTEYALFDEIVESRELFYSLKARGIKLALDDFGTGYSSLGNLRGFPFDRVKLDKSFVSGSECSESARSVAEAVLHIGRALGMAVTAEGVETEDQLEQLAESGFDEVQGYLLARPMPLNLLTAFLYPSTMAARPGSRQVNELC